MFPHPFPYGQLPNMDDSTFYNNHTMYYPTPVPQQQSFAYNTSGMANDSYSECENTPPGGFVGQYQQPQQQQGLCFGQFPTTSHAPAANYHQQAATASSGPYPQYYFDGYMNHQICVNDYRVRTDNRYRAVYSDYQRAELVKEYNRDHCITKARKTELSTMLKLTERQVMIWFQNRRAKDQRSKQKK